MSTKDKASWALTAIALSAVLMYGCGGETSTSPDSPQVAAPGASRNGTDPVTAAPATVNGDSGTNKTTTWGSADNGIYTADFKNKHDVDAGWATLGCFYSDTDPQTFLGQSTSQKFADTGAYHFRVEVDVACDRTVQCDLLVTGPGGFSQGQQGNHFNGNEIIASHGFSTNHCVTPKTPPTPPPAACAGLSGFTHTFTLGTITATNQPATNALSWIGGGQGSLSVAPTDITHLPIGSMVGQSGILSSASFSDNWIRLDAAYLATSTAEVVVIVNDQRTVCYNDVLTVSIPALDAPPRLSWGTIGRIRNRPSAKGRRCTRRAFRG